MPRAERERGHLCPVCVRTTAAGTCAEHGPWQPHQLCTVVDRRRAGRGVWHPFEPAVQACPRCLGDVAEGLQGFECLDHHHGPYRVDELLGPTAQREAAFIRQRLARAHMRRRNGTPTAIPLPSLPPLSEVAHATKLLAAAGLVAGTVAFLIR